MQQKKSKRSMRRAQIAIEYLAIVGFVMLVVIVLFAVSNFYSKDIENQVTLNQIESISKEIIDTAESVYYLGAPSKKMIKVYMPKDVESVSIQNKEILFKVKTKKSTADLSYDSSVDIAGNFSVSMGLKNIMIEAKEGYVLVSGS